VDLRRLLAAGLVCLAAACSGNGSGSSAGSPAHAGHPCTGAAPKPYSHVITIVLENHGFSQVAGDAPFLNALARRCGLAAAYHAVAHPSLPNYLALTSGSTQGLDGSDCSPGSGCRSGGRSIFGQVSWRAYAESMPGTCAHENSGDYAPRHNPAVYYTRVEGACRSNDLPLGGLAGDLRRGRLAAYTFVAPNLCNDAHDCSLAQADGWLGRWVPRILASPAYRSGTTALFVTFDEDEHAEDNRVYTVVVAPSVRPGTVSRTRFTHYSLLRTEEQLLGVPALGRAGSAASMAPAFRLGQMVDSTAP
jgi:phosphatidylinositol-3-phosphatase